MNHGVRALARRRVIEQLSTLSIYCRRLMLGWLGARLIRKEAMGSQGGRVTFDETTYQA
jgi:hypothetical protein